MFSVSFCPDSGYQLACGGHHGGVKIVHLAESGPGLSSIRTNSTYCGNMVPPNSIL